MIPGMIAAGGGTIVNISLITGMPACQGFPDIAYVGNEFAVRAMTKAAAAKSGKQGIRVNSLHPGCIKTPMVVAGSARAPRTPRCPAA